MPAAGDYEAQHRAFLHKLQARNQVKRELQEAKKESESDILRREQNFSLCFSGANARKHPAQGPGRRSASSGASSQESPWGAGRQWEEHTVEIQGIGGEVFALRPTGERRAAALRPPGKAGWAAEPEGLGAADGSLSLQCVDSHAPGEGNAAGTCTSPRLSITQRELRDLLEELEAGTATEEAADPAENPNGDAAASLAGEEEVLPATPALPVPATPPGEAQPGPERLGTPTSSAVLAEAEEVLKQCPTPEDLARRIEKLPEVWRGKLLAFLEEAEASLDRQFGGLHDAAA